MNISKDTIDNIIYVLNKHKTHLVNTNTKLKNDFSENLHYNKLYIDKNNKHIKNINKILNELCNHKWIDDSIDTFYDSCIPITYCEKCELTK